MFIFEQVLQAAIFDLYLSERESRQIGKIQKGLEISYLCSFTGLFIWQASFSSVSFEGFILDLTSSLALVTNNI